MVDQSRVVDRNSFSIWRLDIDHQLDGVSRERIYSRRQTFRISQINRARRFVRIAEARPVSNHLTLLAAGKKRKAFSTGRTLESKKAIAVNSCVAGEHFSQLLSAHTFDRITPKAFHCSDRAHSCL